MTPNCPATNFSKSFFLQTGDKFCLFNKTEDDIPMPNCTDTMIIGCSSLHDYAVHVSLTTFLKGNQKMKPNFMIDSNTVFPHIRPVGIIILCSLQMRVLLENTTFPLHKVI